MNCGVSAYSRSVSAIHSSSSPRLDTVRHSSTSPAFARVDSRPLGLGAQRGEVLVVATRSVVAPEAVRVAPVRARVVETNEACVRILALPLDDPGHELAVQLVACEAEHLVHLLEENDLAERVRELVVDVVAAESGRPFQAAAQPDPLRQMRKQGAQPGVLRRADEHGVRTPVARQLAEVGRLHERVTTYVFLIFAGMPAKGPVPCPWSTSRMSALDGYSRSDPAKPRVAAARQSTMLRRSASAVASRSA